MRSSLLIPAAILVVASTSALEYFLYPTKRSWWIVPTVFSVLFLLDRVQFDWVDAGRQDAARQTQRILRVSFLVFSLVYSVSVLLKIAIRESWIGPGWNENAFRSIGILYSVVWIILGNGFPKMPSPWRYREEPFDWQGVHRFTGMAMVTTGIVSACAWLTLPMSSAKVTMQFSVLALAILVLTRKFYSLATWQHHTE